MPAFFTAYDHLSTCRTSQGAIPWTAVRQYAESHGFDLCFLEDVIFGMERIQRVHNEAREEATDGAG